MEKQEQAQATISDFDLLTQFYKEQDLLDSQQDSKEQLKEVKRINNLNTSINDWIVGVDPDSVITPLHK